LWSIYSCPATGMVTATPSCLSLRRYSA
jgi:hypothetical protein